MDLLTIGIFMYKSRIILRAESYLLRAESYVLRADFFLIHEDTYYVDPNLSNARMSKQNTKQNT